MSSNLVGEASIGLKKFWSLCAESLDMFNFFYHFYYVFSLLCFGCVLFSKLELFVLGLSFDFFVFSHFQKKIEGGFRKKILSSFNLDLIRFGYRGTFFLSHAVILWFCGISKLRW